ncbi:phosphatase PAP2 family protein [Joostella sp. CR20]|uniref:phosphatase PAP2 family protein n=1 Tax=Joostella sp. CR20 TaxID=2804312 RepID=UPI00313F2B7E
MFEKLLKYDQDLLIFLNNLGVEKYDTFWRTVTTPTTWLPLYFLILYLVILTYQKKALYKTLLISLCLILSTSTLTHLIKIAFARVRPSANADFADLLRILIQPNSYSFLSGHAASSFAVCTFFVLILRHRFQWIYLLFLWPLLFSFSRIYVGVHYPSDILAGTIFGILMAWLFYSIHKKWVVNMSSK